MELVIGAEGDPAPRLGERVFSPEAARECHRVLVRQIAGMLSLGLIHGDLSEFNVLLAPDGPVIIDLPQVVNAAGNNGAFAMLERDTNNIRDTLGQYAPELLETQYAREMWHLYQQGGLHPHSELRGVYQRDQGAVDAAGVMQVIDDARDEAIRRELGRNKRAGQSQS